MLRVQGLDPTESDSNLRMPRACGECLNRRVERSAPTLQGVCVKPEIAWSVMALEQRVHVHVVCRASDASI